MGVGDSVPYADAHCREVAGRQDEKGFAPFMHLGEFVEPSAPPISAAEFERAQRVLTERTIALAGMQAGAHVLEVGCGFGGNIAVIDRMGLAARLVGLDIGTRQLELAQRIVRPVSEASIEWVHGDATDLPFTEEAFDVLLAIECAFHFSSRRAFASEARRVLRTGGRLVLTDLVAGAGAGDDGELEKILEQTLAPLPDIQGKEGSWLDIAGQTGFRVVRSEDITRAVMPSFEHILSGKPRGAALHQDENDRGASALHEALRRGLLRVERWALECAR